MADGDYSIPTFPGVMPMGQQAPVVINTERHHGLEGKDATLIHATADAQGKRDITADVLGSSKDNAVQVVETKYQIAENQKISDVRIEQVAKDQNEQMHVVRRELEARVRDESEATRQLIRDMEDKRVRDQKDAALAAQLADIQAKLTILLP